MSLSTMNSPVQCPAWRLAPLALALSAVLTLGACANFAPGYEQPAAAIPAAWPASAAAASVADAEPAADLGWRELIVDERLRQVIALALESSRDLKLAVLAVEQSRAAYDIQSAARLPTVKATASESASRTPAEASSSGAVTHSRSYSVGLGVSAWELDLWGRVRNLQEAALQSYLQTEEAQRSTRLTLIASVATAWLTLGADQAQLQLARDTWASRRDSLAMAEQRLAIGVDSGLTLATARSAAETARLNVAAWEAQVTQDRNALALLLGRALPDDLLPVTSADVSAPAAQLVGMPADLPSSVLQRRPDVLAVEHQLRAAHANIGAARAAFFPTISLTGSVGTASRSLGELFQGGAWSFAPAVSLPIFDSGALNASLRTAQVAREIQLATYDKTLQTAFREVADALAVRASLNERLAAQQALVDSSRRTLALTQARQRVGVDSAMDVLTAQTALYTAQQALITLRLTEQANRITLFKVLGGGWTAAKAG